MYYVRESPYHNFPRIGNHTDIISALLPSLRYDTLWEGFMYDDKLQRQDKRK